MSTQAVRTNLSSLEFIEKLKSQDHQSIEMVVRTYTGDLFRAALGLGFDESRANELVQNVWGTFFESVQKFEGRSHIRTYVFGILYNKAKEMRRDGARTTSVDPFDEVMAHRFDEKGQWIVPTLDPERFVDAAETMDLIEKCMQALPTNQKMAFYLKEVESQSTTEVCNVLSVTATNLGVLLYRARNRLRDCISGKAETRG